MALTPRSFLRNPVLMIAAIVSALIALVGAAIFASALFCSAEKPIKKCKKAKKVDPTLVYRTSVCGDQIAAAPMSPAQWSEGEFVGLASCLQQADEAELSVSASVLGLRHYPTSEALHNLRGIGLIEQEKWEEAVHALRGGLRAVGNPTTGTMENNLAWAGLYASDTMTLSEARQHYQNSLAVDPSSCEAIHTGMWAEYAVASRSHGQSRDAAIHAYRNLRSKYAPCTSRARFGDDITKFEVAGAGLLDTEMTKLAMVQMFERHDSLQNGRIHWKDFDSALLRTALVDVDIRNRAALDDACEAIAPVKSARPECRRALQAKMH